MCFHFAKGFNRMQFETTQEYHLNFNWSGEGSQFGVNNEPCELDAMDGGAKVCKKENCRGVRWEAAT